MGRIGARLGVAATAALYVIALGACKPAAPGAASGARGLEGMAHGAMANLKLPTAPAPQPDPAMAATFTDGAGKTVRLSDFKGQVVVANLWATWCAPCVKEMPTLAKLAGDYAGKPVKILALSVDRPTASEKARAFIEKNAPLAFYIDGERNVQSALQPYPEGFPTTYLYGKDGKLRGVVSQGTDWSSADVKAVIDRLLAE